MTIAPSLPSAGDDDRILRQSARCWQEGYRAGQHRASLTDCPYTIGGSHGGLWINPWEKTKNGRPHRIPLTRQAHELLSRLTRDGSGLLFPNKDGKTMSNMTMQKLFKSMKPGLTVHGFRSAAKDWCAENGVPHEVSEAMLGHSIAKNQTVAAYLRTDFLDERWKVMQRVGPTSSCRQ